jgi:GNAT superfamily N-acetyltransferase
MPVVRIEQAVSGAQIGQVRELMAEYFEFLRTDIDTDVPDMDSLPPVAGFAAEMASLPGKYAPPDGRLLLASIDGEPAGCVAFHKFEDGVCEIKRLWARPKFRGMKVGRSLLEALITEARSAGYRAMILSTVDKLKEAHALYGALGFRETEPYFDGPEEMMAHEIFMRLELSG